MTPKSTRWRGVVTEQVKFVPDERRMFYLNLSQFAGQEVIVTVAGVPKKQSRAKRGFYHAVMKVAFHRWLSEQFREHYGVFTFDEAHDLLVRLVLNLPDDVERASTATDAMTDEAYEDFLFRAEGFLADIGCDVPRAEVDPVRRLEQTPHHAQMEHSQ